MSDDRCGPLHRLSRCHRRIEREAQALRELVERLDAQSPSQLTPSGPTKHVDAASQASAAAVLRYFDTIVRDHHRDEEAELFPALIESMAGSDAVCLHEIISGLIAEHRELDIGWHRLREPLVAIAEGELRTLDRDAVVRWLELTRRHLATEDQELLPMAERLLDDDALIRIGDAMQARHRQRYGDGTPGAT